MRKHDRVNAFIPRAPARDRDPVAIASGVVTVAFGKPIAAEARCHYCPRPATTRDHIVAKTRGGADSWWNLVPACADCNSKKGSDGSGCWCAFCERARFLYDRGHRRSGSGVAGR